VQDASEHNTPVHGAAGRLVQGCHTCQRDAVGAAGQTQVICFSRHVNTKMMKLGPQNRMGKLKL
jgi:hypothetical protein